MKDKRLSFWNTRWGNFFSFELATTAALLTVGLICLVVPLFSSFIVPLPTRFGIDMSPYLIMAMLMMPIFTLLSTLVATGVPKYNEYNAVKGKNFPVPFYVDCNEYGKNQPMFSAYDYKLDGKKLGPVWKDNYEWDDTLRFDPDFDGKRVVMFRSVNSDNAYPVDSRDLKFMIPKTNLGGIIRDRFTFIRHYRSYSIIPVDANIKLDD